MSTMHEHATRWTLASASAIIAALSLGSCSRAPSLPDDHWALGPACPRAPVIAIVDDGGSCELDGDVPPGWRARVMFETGSPGVEALGSAPARLARYCSYEWQGEGAPRDAHAALRAAIDADPHVQVETAAPDCHAPEPQGREHQLAVDLATRDAFRLDLDWVDGQRLEPSASSRAAVQVAIADTISTELGDRTPGYVHGLVVAGVIRDIACPDAHTPCAAELRHTMAMPRRDVHSPPEWTVGGDRGLRSDVALAIYEAVEVWRQRRLNDPDAPRRLVLNLSLGWTPDPLQELAPSQALLDALRFASCQGALIFASAGNDPRRRPGISGPLEPAIFETRAAPSAEECAALGFVPISEERDPVFGPRERPLLYAVGGVDGDDRPLLDARPDGRPRLATPAIDGIGRGPDDALTRSLSGSSIAAAVASGSAALVWSYRPRLRPDEVVELLYEAGWDTGDTADFGLGQRDAIRRLSVCAALALACEGQPEHACPQLRCRAKPPAGAKHRAALKQAFRELSEAERSR